MYDDDSDDTLPLCAVCRQPTMAGPVCSEDRETMARQLHGLVGQTRRLEAELVPGARRGDGQPTGPKPGGSPAPARLDALSLLGPGSGAVTALLHPQIRYWSTTEDVDVQALHTVRKIVRGQVVETGAVITERRAITRWHRELAVDEHGRPVMAADDDQVGALPPREWLASWADVWQDILHHHGPAARRFQPATPPAGPGSPARAAALARLAADPATSTALTAAWAVRAEYDRAVQATLAGQTFGFAGDTTRWARPDDPTADELEARFGSAPTSTIVARLAAFLILWLDEACLHPDVPIGDFAGELRALSAELARVLGDQPAQLWLGRCPARLTTPAPGGAETTRPCGAGIWQDPHTSQVQCPRCHSTWGPRRVDLLRLALEIRATWPVDRRRRYTDEERRQTRRPKCPACGAFAAVTWREVTGTEDPWRTWQPVGAVCPNSCPQTREVI